VSSLIGRTLGQYEVIELLGKGGMATVYLGRQTSIDRNVAIKVLPPHPGLDESFKERFELEARTIGGLQHPNILPLYDYGTQDDVLYLVMAYADGGSLDDLIDSGAMNTKQVEKYLRAIASGLDYAHSRGVIHRDVKPGNILINEDHLMLADFGMVKMSVGENNLTGTAIVGTPAYMAPEQGQGLEYDHRIDIYALGVMLYEMLTGQQPYSGASPMQMIISHINDDIPDVRDERPELPEAIASTVKKAMAKDADERYSTAAELAEAFSSALHKNPDSLAAIKQEYPINTRRDDGTARRNSPPTVVFDSNASNPNVQDSGTQSQTIIMREATNPLVILGGFGLIALVIVIVAVLLNDNGGSDEPAVILATVEPTARPPATAEPTVAPRASVEHFGTVRFSQDDRMGDTLSLRLDGARPAPNDQDYAAWLINTDGSETIRLGRVLVSSLGEGSIVYTDEEGRMLPAMFNQVLITLEDSIGDQPTGDVVYSGRFPVTISEALVEIFVTSSSGIETRGEQSSLLDSALIEARVAAQHAGFAVSAGNIRSARTHAEHTINILRGTEEDWDGSGTPQNPGRGIGVYTFLDAIDEQLDAVVAADAESQTLLANAEFIRVCTANVRTWADEIVTLEQEIIAGEEKSAVQDEAELSETLADQLKEGYDLNQNGIVEPFEGECGLEQIPEYGLQIAEIKIVEGDVRADDETSETESD
jgi:serine/threonine protein kinase